MPAGLAWGPYVSFTTCALLSMFAGSQMVHVYFRPLDDMEDYINKVQDEYKVK